MDLGTDEDIIVADTNNHNSQDWYSQFAVPGQERENKVSRSERDPLSRIQRRRSGRRWFSPEFEGCL